MRTSRFPGFSGFAPINIQAGAIQLNEDSASSDYAPRSLERHPTVHQPRPHQPDPQMSSHNTHEHISSGLNRIPRIEGSIFDRPQQPRNQSFNFRNNHNALLTYQVNGGSGGHMSQMGRSAARVGRQNTQNFTADMFVGQNTNVRDDLNIEDIDILEDELRRSNQAGGGHQMFGHINSIQRYDSFQIRSQLSQSRQGRQTASLINQQQDDQRNMTLSRMLTLYRNRRGLYRDASDQFIPRTVLTQNFMNDESTIHGSVNRRSENFRRNFENMDQLINHLRNERRNEAQTQQENISSNGGNNFDHIAQIYTPVVGHRRPITRAAGYSSGQNQNLINSNSNSNNLGQNINFLNSQNNSSIQPGNNQSQNLIEPVATQQAQGQRRTPEQQLQPLTREQRQRRARYLNILRLRIPTFDDNFLSRSETQIQNQFHQRSMGLAPRQGRQGQDVGEVGSGGPNELNHYQSFQFLPTMNEVGGNNYWGGANRGSQPLLRYSRSRERLYTRGDDNMMFPFLQEDCTEENYGDQQNQSQLSDRELQNINFHGVGEELDQNVISSEDDPIPLFSDTSPHARGSQGSDFDFSENFGEEERILRNVRRNQINRGSTIRNLREMEDTNIGIGTFNLMDPQRVRRTVGQNEPVTRRNITYNNEINLRGLGDGRRVTNADNLDKRSKQQLIQDYIKIEDKIPEEWRIEELSQARVTDQDFLVSYLHEYGPLSVLIYLRTQNEIQMDENEEEEKKVSDDLTDLVFLPLSSDYMKFVERILNFYRSNFFMATRHGNLSARKRLDRFFKKIVPDCRQLRDILTLKRKKQIKQIGGREKDEQGENIVYIVILQLLESYHREFNQNQEKGRKSFYEKCFLPLAMELFLNHVKQSDLDQLRQRLTMSDLLDHSPSSSMTTIEGIIQYFRDEKVATKSRRQLTHIFQDDLTSLELRCQKKDKNKDKKSAFPKKKTNKQNNVQF